MNIRTLSVVTSQERTHTVAARRGPTFRRRALGKELRMLRERTGITIKEAATGLGFSETKLSRVETGHNNLPRVEDLEGLLDRYGVTDIDQRDTMLNLHRESLSRDPYVSFQNMALPGMPMYASLESDAREIRAWHPMYVFGLLQCESYMRAQFTISKPVNETTTQFIENNVRLRMERKNVLTRQDDPVALCVVLDESVLRRVIGSPEVMKRQYAELHRLCALDNVTVQVLPLRNGCYRAGSDFAILNFGASMDSVVYMDDSTGFTVTDREFDILQYNRRLDAMRSEALGPSATPALLESLAKELESA
ncbi:Scr1 family TA system antitoxin-like transcriptional regulator [Streptomyces sp. NPDC005955]|uniref:helix-turn-helix domain-containing protein n=1 Tax=Streptomyces sp. NPDC005955 TaxID=3364738 RepID=UPI0036C2A1FA